MSNALALAQWLPDVETLTPNAGDVVQVVAVPINQIPATQFASVGSGGGGGAAVPRATKEGQFVVSGNGPSFPLIMSDADAGRF